MFHVPRHVSRFATALRAFGLYALLGGITAFCFGCFIDSDAAQAMPPRSPNPAVWIVHGFQGQEQDFSKEFVILWQIYQLPPNTPCFTWRWPAPEAKFYDIRDKWKKALKDQRVASENLFQDIRRLPKEDQQRLILAGHSLGGGIVIHALAKCAKENIKIDHFVLMGAAIAYDDPDIALAMEATTRRSYSLANMSDYALGAYRIMENTPALGTGYAFMADETKLSELVFEGMEDSHAAADYLGNFLKCVERNQYKYDGILVPQDWRHVSDTTSAEAEKETQSMFKERGMPNGILTFAIPWRDVEEMDGWVLQKRNVIPQPYYRILSPDKRTMAWGWGKRMAVSFAKVKAQLVQKVPLPPFQNVPSQNVGTLGGTAPAAPNAYAGVSQSQIATSWPGWNTLDAYYGWRLQKSSSSNRCRILDPNERQTAEGDEETLRRAFERLKTVVGNPTNGSSTKLAPVTNAYPNRPTGNGPTVSNPAVSNPMVPNPTVPNQAVPNPVVPNQAIPNPTVPNAAPGTSQPDVARRAPVGTAEENVDAGTSRSKSNTGWFGWKTLEVYYGWKLQKSKSSNKCRILDPYGRQTAEGDEETLRRVFEQQKTSGGKPN